MRRCCCCANHASVECNIWPSFSVFQVTRLVKHNCIFLRRPPETLIHGAYSSTQQLFFSLVSLHYSPNRPRSISASYDQIFERMILVQHRRQAVKRFDDANSNSSGASIPTRAMSRCSAHGVFLATTALPVYPHYLVSLQFSSLGYSRIIAWVIGQAG